MYADRTRGHGIKPGSLAVAMAINGGLFAALLFAAPDITERLPTRYLPIDLIPLPTPTPAEPTPAPPKAELPVQRQVPPIDQPVRKVEMPAPTDAWVAGPQPFPTPSQPAGGAAGAEAGTAGGSGTVIVDPVRPVLPVLVEPAIDPRHAGRFQPDYPAAERRAEREGRVVVRVLVGVDGRVKRLERVSATSDAFWQATEQRAMSAWRFTPGTRDGIPVEAWRTLSLRFVLEE